MSIDQQIATLEKLAAVDAIIKELSQGIAEKRGALGGLREELEELIGRLSADGESVSEMDKTRSDLVLEMRQLAGQVERSRERLQRARNEREVNAAERELDELRKIQRDRDEEIKKLAELADQARGGMKESEARRSELASALEGTVEGSTKAIEDLEAKLAVEQEKRAAISKDLPSLVFRRYERMHQKGRVPIAKTHDGTCLGCFVKIPPMMFHHMLSRTKFEECGNCHRIIYYEPPPTEEELAAQKAAQEAEQSPEEEAAATEGE